MLPMMPQTVADGQVDNTFDTARSKADGLRRIAFWRQRVTKSGLTCFDAFLALLDRWLDLTANYFIDHQMSGFVEELNNKLKVLKPQCYGCVTLDGCSSG